MSEKLQGKKPKPVMFSFGRDATPDEIFDAIQKAVARQKEEAKEIDEESKGESEYPEPPEGHEDSRARAGLKGDEADGRNREETGKKEAETGKRKPRPVMLMFDQGVSPEAILAAARKAWAKQAAEKAEIEAEEKKLVANTIARPQLPNIKMTPDDARVIYGVLIRCDENTRLIYTLLMEKWARAGYFVETTSSSIVLDAPYGATRTRIAILMPGSSEEIAKLIPGIPPRPAEIVLRWESLRQQSGIPADSFDLYQETVAETVPFHTTDNSAHIESVDSMEPKVARQLLRAMVNLAKSIRHDLVEAPKLSQSVTPANIESTLAACDVHTRTIFQKVMEAWKMAGGTVLCGRVGRIYLKLKTRVHTSGKNARLARNFNLAVLAGPKGKRQATIQVAWGLAGDNLGAYLDNIPEAVDHFEKVIAFLPGFEQKGTITYLEIDNAFQDKHTALLIGAMRELKDAETHAI